MKAKSFSIAMAILPIFFIASFGARAQEKGVVINGVTWATRNVDEPGAFASKPEDAGKFYQWNRKKAWSTTGEVSGWSNSYATDDSWEKANDPCPVGWRVPALLEVQRLLDEEKVKSEWTTLNGVKGRKFTDKATGNSIFLPALGLRNGAGVINFAGTDGLYWTASQNSADRAGYLQFEEPEFGWYYGYRNYGMNVRAVAE